MRLAWYAAASTSAAAACLIKAFHERPNFYSATVYLSQSNACLLILTNLLLMCAFGFIYGLQRLLYGRLRPIEIEQLSEKAWYAVLDTLLAMPSFREDVGIWLLTMFVLLLAGRVWGWIGEGRVDILEQQPPANPRLFHARLATSLSVSVLFDIWMTWFCFDNVVADPKPGMMVIFTFEFAILTIFSTFTLLRYTLSVISTIVTHQQLEKAIEERKKEIRAERAAAREAAGENGEAGQPQDEPIEVDENEVDVPGWEEKRRWLFGLEVFSDFLKLLLYVVFFTVSITFNGLPMHIMRDVYMTAASFTKRVSDYMNYKKATSDMNARYPDATTEEIRGDACIVCREDMVSWSEPADQAARTRRDEGQRAKKLPCGHILHLRCLKAWLERQQVCPTCRRPVIPVARATPAVDEQAQRQRRPADQAPVPAARRNPNRARIFNLGPLRIGFLNGPAGQMDNIVNQLRNGEDRPAVPEQPAAGQALPTVQAGMQSVPAAGQTQQGPQSRLSHDETFHMGMRVGREAALLATEAAEVEIVRRLMAELCRLRLVHQAQTNGTPLPRIPQFIAEQMIPQHNQPMQLQSGHSQRIPAGSPELPPGLVLPEGWTMTPLHRVQHSPHTPLQEAAAFVPTDTIPVHSPNQVQTAPSAEATASTVPNSWNATATASHNDHPQSSLNAGPTDDSGSPLFLPQPRPAEQSTAADGLASEHNASRSQTEQHDDASAPKPTWTGSSWSFDPQADPQDSQESSTSSAGKGKGRAVEVEDAPDAENE